MWKNLPKPFFVLAPMDDVTDTVFRRVVDEVAAPDVFFTEFANADGLQSPGRSAVIRKLLLEDTDTPVVAQIWGKNPDNYYKTSKELAEKGFSGIDINMGCPVRAVVKNGCCSALIDNRDLAHDLIEAASAGIRDSGLDVALSVKTRIGYSDVRTEDWCGWLLQHRLDALSVHGRISVEMSKYPADWSEIGRLPALRDSISPDTAIIGNGDVMSRRMGEDLAKRSGVDGVMIGRGIFQNPWIFDQKETTERSPEEYVLMLGRHMQLWREVWGGDKAFDVMKKFFKMYISGWDGAASDRTRLMDAATIDDAEAMLDGIKRKLLSQV